MITVACVRTGTRYGTEYVYRLKAGVERHLKQPHWFVCLTDRPSDLDGVETIDICADGLSGWWAKMILFRLASRLDHRLLYFDLDTVVVGSLDRLADLNVDFGICENFTRLAGNENWPCRYGSCVMSFSAGFGCDVWQEFDARRDHYMNEAGRYGDQKAIEKLLPVAALFQTVLPYGFFLGYRDIDENRPEACSLVIFAGQHKPHNCTTAWIVDAWKS